jgi:hypothetical protein
MLTGLKPRGFTWVIASRLAVSERIGGNGFQHRRVRREEEITWLKNEAGVTSVISLLPANQNLSAYRDAGLQTHQMVVAPKITSEDAGRVFGLLDEALADPTAVVLVHREIIDDTLAGLLGGYLIASGRLNDRVLAAAVIQEILGRPLGPEGRALLPEPPEG